MATISWATPASIATALSTELNSLADGSYSNASTAYDNLTNLYLYCQLELVLASLTPGTGGYVSVYLVKQLDGTNYEDGGGATAPRATSLVCTFDLSTSTGAKRQISMPFPIPPCPFKFVLYNKAGVSLGASGNTLKYKVGNETVA